MNHRRKLLATLALWLMMAGVSQSQETYLIKLTAPRRVGDKYHLRARISETKIDPKASGQQLRVFTNKSEIELEGNIEVIEVDAHGFETRLSCTVDRCFSGSGGTKKKILEKGDVVLATAKKREMVFLSNNREISWETDRCLNKIFQPPSAEADEEEIFGTKTPKKIGERWRINSEAAVSRWNHYGPWFHVKAFEGDSCLRGITTLNGEKCLEIESAARLVDLKPPDTPSNIKVKDMSCEIKTVRFCPAGRPPLRECNTAKFVVNAGFVSHGGTVFAQFIYEISDERDYF